MIEVSARTLATIIVRLTQSNDPIARAGERYAPQVERLFRQSVSKVQAAVPIKKLEEVIGFGPAAVLYVLEPAIQVYLSTLLSHTPHIPHSANFTRSLAAKTKTIEDVLLDTMGAGANASLQIVNLDMAFDVANPEAVVWAKGRAGELVVDIMESTRQAIRSIIVDGFQYGISPRESATLLRAIIGLTERDALAVMRRQIKLLVQGVKSLQAAAQAKKYAAKLLRTRAKTIAITETMRASNEGQMQLWRQAKGKGLLDDTATKTWIVADPCPICAPLEGETVPAFEDFSIGMNPPAHVRCRCTMGLNP